MFPEPPPPVVVVQKKRGMGCFGIGCVILFIAMLLIGGLIVLMLHLTAGKLSSITSPTPITTQSFDGGDNVYAMAESKLSNFQLNQQQNRPASIELSADEINTMIARDPDFENNHIHVFVSMNGNRMKIDGTLPGDLVPLPFGLLKNQFINGTVDFSPSVNPATKDVNFQLYELKIGDESVPTDQLSTIQTQMNPFINTQLHASANTQGFLSHVQALEVSDGKLKIQMQ